MCIKDVIWKQNIPKQNLRRCGIHIAELVKEWNAIIAIQR